ncbi:MAG: aspartate aminotransferase family protein [Myxococcota bacterium]
MSSPIDPLLAAYEPEAFRAQGHRLIDALADYLGATMRGEGPVLPDAPPERTVAAYNQGFPTKPTGEDLVQLVTRVLAQSNHLHHPRYMGHQVSTPLPMAALCDMVAALANNGMAVYEMGPAATGMESAVVGWMAERLGLDPARAGGILTSGGSVGNLTALLAMRQARAGHDVWEQGAGPKLGVLVSDQAHYSVARAIRIMGWGADGIVPVATDARFRMRADELGGALAKARERGIQVIGVISSSCGTSLGAFDPLEAIADFCEQHELWLHVDGAHGAAAVLTPKYASLLRGCERADSVVWDAHKMLCMPALVTAVIYRDGGHANQAFAQQAAYLFGKNVHDSGLRTLECTKRMMSLKVYATLRALGTDAIGAYVERMFDMGKRLGRLIAERPALELAVDPDCNIVCFRARREGVGGPELDAIQTRVRAQVVESGEFYIVQTKLPAGAFLRVTLVNPLTSEADLTRLLDRVEALAG